MIRKLLAITLILNLTACAELQHAANQINTDNSGTSSTSGTSSIFGNADIASALRQALDLGIEKQVAKLTQPDGFYGNEKVKILLPEDLKKVDAGLRNIGLGSLADEGIKLLNEAASEAVKEATPIFTDAVKEITFSDAKDILMGNDNSATQYLESKTQTSLYSKFNPVIKSSLSKVGADKAWSNLITKYNNIPFTDDVNPDLNDYVTKEALKGVFTMIAVEEKDIRTQSSLRTTDLLKGVFALQD